MAENSQPKIPVKKSDGSTVFMTMDEFRAYKNQGTALSGAVVSVPPISPMPVTPIIVPELKSEPVPVLSPEPKAEEIKVEPVEEIPVEPLSEQEPQGELSPEILPEPDLKITILTVPPVSSKPEPIIETSIEPAPKTLEEGKIEIIEEDPNANTPQEEALLVLGEQSLATTTPVVDAFVHESESKKTWKKEDHDSLLEESSNNTLSGDQTTPAPQEPAIDDKYKAIVQTVKSQFPYPLAKNLEARFDSLVVSRLKDVRTVYEVEEYALKSTDQGGLAFNEDQAKLLNAIISAAQKLSGGGDSAPKPRRPVPPPSLANTQVPKPALVPTPTPVSAPISVASVAAPEPLRRETITKIHVPESKSSAPQSQSSSSSYKFPLSGEEYKFTPPSSPSTTSSASGTQRIGKIMVEDVVAPVSLKKTMGPVDELHIFSLVDFRRLSPKTEAAKEIMKEKFAGLKEESYVLFLDARDAWRESPLFQIYEEIVLSALETKISIEESISGHSSALTHDEFLAILELNKFLG